MAGEQARSLPAARPPSAAVRPGSSKAGAASPCVAGVGTAGGVVPGDATGAGARWPAAAVWAGGTAGGRRTARSEPVAGCQPDDQARSHSGEDRQESPGGRVGTRQQFEIRDGPRRGRRPRLVERPRHPGLFVTAHAGLRRQSRRSGCSGTAPGAVQPPCLGQTAEAVRPRPPDLLPALLRAPARRQRLSAAPRRPRPD